MVDNKEKSTCSGCTACVNICPANCISMQSDEQGFLYPVIDKDLCTQCGLCDKTCEKAAGTTASDVSSKGYGMRAKDIELQRNSSSGGVFSLLCSSILSEGGVVAGAAMTDDLRSVQHVFIEDENGLSVLRGAKYLQSKLDNSFSIVSDYLKKGRKVLFSGTPCQIDGLKAFIGNNDENLLCVDMICHGIPSPMIWSKYCDEIEKSEKGQIRSVNFRYKKYSWEKPQKNDNYKDCKMVFQSKDTDPYMRLFLSDYTLRPSCYECRHKGIDRKSDITIADFWGINKIAPGLSNGLGTSLIMVHTEKGEQYIRGIADNAVMQEIDLNEAIMSNKSAINSARKPERLIKFWNDQAAAPIKTLADTYAPLDIKEKGKSKLMHSSVYGLTKKGKKVNMENGILFVLEKN